MSFSESGGVITQTGTDTNLSGLSGLTGVATTTSDPSAKQSGYRIYQIDTSTRLDITGTLTIDPDVEQLVLEKAATTHTTDNPLIVSSGGTLNLGVTKTGNGQTVYSQGVGINFTAEGTNFFGYFGGVVKNGGTLNWRGGIVRTGSTFRANQGSTITVDKGTFFNTAVTDQMQFRVTTTTTGGDANINFNDLILDGISAPARIFTTSGWNNAKFTFLTGQFQTYNSPFPELTLENFNVTENIASADIYSSTDSAANAEDITTQNTSRRLNYGAQGGRNLYSLNRRQLGIEITDLSGSAINYSYYAIDVDNGSRGVGPMFAVDGSQDDTADKVYSGINQTGNISDNVYIEIARLLEGGTADIVVDDRTIAASSTDSYGTINFRVIGYNEGISTYNPNLVGLGTLSEKVKLVPDLSITEATKATVDAYTTLETPEKFYDRAKAYLYDNYAGETSTIVSRSGSSIDLGAYDLTIDATAGIAFALVGNIITIKATVFTGDLTTTGNITLANGASILGTYTDASGTTATRSVSITGIVAGSRLQAYNVTTATEVVNEVVAGTSYSAYYNEGTGYTEGDTIRVRLTCQSGATACDWFSVNALASDSGWNVIADQQTLAAYATIGIDGSTVTEYSLDGTNVQVDANDLDGQTTKKRLVAWYYYAGTTTEGIRSFFAGIMLEDAANAKIQTSIVDLTVDNTSSRQLQMTDTDFRLYRDDSATWIEYPSSGGYGIDNDSGKVFLTSSSDITDMKATIDANLDETVSSRSAQTNVDTIETAVTTNLDTTVSSRATQTSVDALPDSVPTASENADAVWSKNL